MAKAILLAVLLASAPAYAIPDYETGRDLVQDCTAAMTDAGDGLLSSVHCMGFLLGMIEMHDLVASSNPDARIYCLPDGEARMASVSGALQSYLKVNDAWMDLSGSALVAQAMRHSYPCE